MSTSAFGDFSRERADRARRLLEESEEQRGSSDLQASRPSHTAGGCYVQQDVLPASDNASCQANLLRSVSPSNPSAEVL